MTFTGTVFYGTFGSGHTFGLTSVKIHARDMEDARHAMFYSFGNKFCTVYDEDYANSEHFQPVVMELAVHRPDQWAEPEVRCVNLIPTAIRRTR